MTEPAVKKQKKEESIKEDELEEDEETANWWQQEEIKCATRGEKRWDTLSHNGVLFPPPYTPHGIPIRYDGKEFRMTPEEEEVATMFAVLREHDYYRMRVFRDNFFRSWREILDKRGSHPIRELALCDFDDIYQWSVLQKEKKAQLTREEKKKIKEQSDAEAEPFRYCLWNGKKEQVANFRVEPPGLFRGRGQHPLAGTLKKRVQPEDVTINIGVEAEVPAPPPGHRWAEVRHDNEVTWLAMWRDNVTGSFKYVMLAPSSSVKGQSDYLKYEKARSLKNCVESIRQGYMADFKSRDSHIAQRAVAMYFIDRLALRVGNEKGEDEADTVGCCSLRVEHLELMPDNVVRFDFLGKDSIRYQNDVQVLPEVYALLRRFMSGKRPTDDVFDNLTTTQLNQHLKSFMDGLSAKVFRTYNASVTLQNFFREKPVDEKSTVADKLAYFNQANTQVAILCNHQKSVSKNFHVQIQQMSAETKYIKDIYELLLKARETAEKKSMEAAAKEFYEAHDRIQRDWLDAYGTDEQKAEFEELVKSRSLPKTSSSGAKKKKKSSGSSKKAAASAGGSKSKSKSKKKKASKSKAKKSSAAAAKKTTAKKAKSPAKKKKKAAAATKKESAKKAKTEKAAVKQESSDDDIPLSDLK